MAIGMVQLAFQDGFINLLYCSICEPEFLGVQWYGVRVFNIQDYMLCNLIRQRDTWSLYMK